MSSPYQKQNKTKKQKKKNKINDMANAWHKQSSPQNDRPGSTGLSAGRTDLPHTLKLSHNPLLQLIALHFNPQSQI